MERKKRYHLVVRPIKNIENIEGHPEKQYYTETEHETDIKSKDMGTEQMAIEEYHKWVEDYMKLKTKDVYLVKLFDWEQNDGDFDDNVFLQNYVSCGKKFGVSCVMLEDIKNMDNKM